MSLFSTSGARPVALTPLPASAQGGKGIGAQFAPPSGNVAARLPTVDPVPVQNDIVNLSSQALQARGADLAASTSDIAQNFMNAFAKRLFGEQASTSNVAYNMSAFSSAASTSTASTDSAGATTHNSVFDLSQSASFTGTGQITTGDGRVFDFELSVKYEAKVSTSSTGTAAPGKAPTLETPDVLVLTGKPLPAIKFPGSLDDLFKMLSRELRTEVSGAPGQNGGGDLTLRLMRLVDRAALLAPRVRADDPTISPAEQAKAVANSYGSAPAIDQLPAA
jgi:hypothetical protein